VVEPQLKQTYIEPGKVKLVWHDFTWIGEESRTAAQAARCAGDQGEFWAYHDYLYTHQRGENAGQFSTQNLKSFAAAIEGLDTAAFNACLDSGRDLGAIRQAFEQGRAQGIVATPYFLIDGQPRAGLPSPTQFAALLDAELARVGH
jgi:protein-disulfide isomerase